MTRRFHSHDMTQVEASSVHQQRAGFSAFHLHYTAALAVKAFQPFICVILQLWHVVSQGPLLTGMLGQVVVAKSDCRSS